VSGLLVALESNTDFLITTGPRATSVPCRQFNRQNINEYEINMGPETGPNRHPLMLHTSIVV
jgi:hypothetical protein